MGAAIKRNRNFRFSSVLHPEFVPWAGAPGLAFETWDLMLHLQLANKPPTISKPTNQ
jgi:hypothetical protein